MPGPVSVFDGPAYAGDAQIGHVSVGDSRLLAYAIDLDVATTVKDDSTATVQKIRIVGGLIEQTTKRENRVGYAFTNKDAKRGRTILIEHPKVPGWTLVDPAKPSEETTDLYRFELDTKPGEAKALAVKQERVERQSLQVVGYDLKALLAYSKDGKASAKVVEAVQHAAGLQAKINEIERLIGELDRESTAINTDQSRIRQNMQTVERTTDLYKRYMTKLGEQETRLEQLTTEREKATTDQTSARAELEGYLRGLNVE
jgi:exonuclease VII small subunit